MCQSRLLQRCINAYHTSYCDSFKLGLNEYQLSLPWVYISTVRKEINWWLKKWHLSNILSMPQTKSPAIFSTKEISVFIHFTSRVFFIYSNIIVDRFCMCVLTRHTCNVNRFSATIFFSTKSVINSSPVLYLSLSLHLSICLLNSKETSTTQKIYSLSHNSAKNTFLS